MRRMCPSCYRHNRAWVLYATCPFCGARGKPIPEVVGLEWPTKLRDMLLTTETDLGRSYRLKDARAGRVPTLADLGMESAPVHGPSPTGEAAAAILEVVP
jgi:hypothetical protein